MQKGPSSHIKQVELIPTRSHTATQTGTGVDVSDFNHARISLIRGTFSGDESVTVTIEESDVLGSGYDAVTGAAFTAITTANDEDVPLLGTIYLPDRKKYLRAVGTATGTGAAIYGVLLDLVGPTKGSLANNSFAFEV